MNDGMKKLILDYLIERVGEENSQHVFTILELSEPKSKFYRDNMVTLFKDIRVAIFDFNVINWVTYKIAILENMEFTP